MGSCQSAANYVISGSSRLKSGEIKAVEVTVGSGASLSLSSSEGVRVVPEPRKEGFSRQDFNCCVESGGLFVQAPSAISIGEGSRLKQSYNITLQDSSASAIIVDVCDTRRVQTQVHWLNKVDLLGIPSFIYLQG